MAINKELENRCINTIRILSIDAVRNSNAGHLGMPMGAAAMAYKLWTGFLKHNPKNPQRFDRDRFILSPGHGSMLLYSLPHLTGYDLSLDEIKRFRKWGSKTPGHPDRGQTQGGEVTTEPLGQGFGNGVGMAAAEAWLAARYNRPGTRWGIGASQEVLEHLGFTADHVAAAALRILGRNAEANKQYDPETALAPA